MRCLTVVVVLVGSCGGADGGCGSTDYAKITDVRIDYSESGGAWTRSALANRRTHGWPADQLDRISSVFWPPGGGTSTLRVTGLQPRELFVFNHSTAIGDMPLALANDHQFVSAVPGVAASAPFQVEAVRLLDHGGCRISIPFGTPEAGLFAEIRSALAERFIGELRDGGAGDPRESWFYAQASFVQRTGATSEHHDDGFLIYAEYRGDAPIFVSDPVIGFVWKYAFHLDRGFPAVRAIFNWRFIQLPPGRDLGAAREKLIEGLNVTLPTLLQERVLYATDAAGAPSGAAAPLIGPCAADDPDADDKCDNAGNRAFLSLLIKDRSGAGGTPLSEAAARVIADAQKHEDFVCRGDTGVCHWRPSFTRIVVRPDGIEAVLNEAGDDPPAEYDAIRYLSPNTNVDCTLARTPSRGAVTWISRGRVPPAWPH